MSATKDEKTQLDRFKEAAREVEADQSDDALDRIVGRLDLTKKPEPKPPGVDILKGKRTNG
jgi:hypothetical protein